MNMVLDLFILSFVSIFIILDPFANIPFFSSVLGKYDAREKRGIISRSIVIAFCLFLLFSIFGTAIFAVLGIEFYSFQIAGGIILGMISIEQLSGKTSRTKTTKTSTDMAKETAEKENLTITPLATPMLTGPGAITTGLVLYGKAVGITGYAEFIVAATLAFIAVYIILAHSVRIEKMLGNPGMRILNRVMGLLLLSISVQLVIKGAGLAITGISAA